MTLVSSSFASGVCGEFFCGYDCLRDSTHVGRFRDFPFQGVLMYDAEPHKNVEINDARLTFLEASRRPDDTEEMAALHPEPDDLVEQNDACPRCGERRMQKLVWQADHESIRCDSCGASYGFKK